MFTSCKLLPKAIEIIKNKLYWISERCIPKKESKTFFFNIDQDLVYQPYFFDFGPLDIGKVCKFVTEVEKLLKCSQFSDSKIYHHTSLDPAKRANAAFLMGAFQVIILGRTAEEAWEPFRALTPALIPFRDALDGACEHKCTILDCLKGIEYAIKLGWFDIGNFDVKSYEHFEKVENGDMNWIIPGKLLAFSGPSDKPQDPDGFPRLTPENYAVIFRKMNVKMVIRLSCSKEYDAERFKKHGLKHVECFFPDGGCPNDMILDQFLTACEQEKGAIAVHCKAGLGRTGTMIAAYAMKHYKFPATNFIGWIRLCRPGSILGKQQQFLLSKETYLHGLSQNSNIFASLRLKSLTKASFQENDLVSDSHTCSGETTECEWECGECEEGNDRSRTVYVRSTNA